MGAAWARVGVGVHGQGATSGVQSWAHRALLWDGEEGKWAGRRGGGASAERRPARGAARRAGGEAVAMARLVMKLQAVGLLLYRGRRGVFCVRTKNVLEIGNLLERVFFTPSFPVPYQDTHVPVVY